MIDKAKLGSQAEQPVPARAGASPSRVEAEGKRDEFREAMRQDTEKGASGGGPGNRSGDKDDLPLPPPLSGDALLRGLGGAYAPLETQGAAPSLAAMPDAQSLAAELAERVLVNTDNRAAGGEVRITLKESVLPDTEIILRQEGERLTVQLVSGNPVSLDALRLSQEDLRSKLMALDRDVSVEVLDSREREGEDGGHSGRRSRGLDYFAESER